jgi:hypothetical protein
VAHHQGAGLAVEIAAGVRHTHTAHRRLLYNRESAAAVEVGWTLLRRSVRQVQNYERDRWSRNSIFPVLPTWAGPPLGF